MSRSSLPRRFSTFANDRSGNVLITTALALPVMIGMTALSVEYGGGLMKRVENQRVADLAAFAAATAYGAKNSEAAMRDAAHNIARLNDLAPAAMTIALVDSPRGGGAKGVKVDVATQQNLYLARVLGNFEQLQVKANAIAEVGSKPSEPGCVYALSASEGGITMSGGTTLRARDCAVSSNTTVTVPCGTRIEATAVNYNTTRPQPCDGNIAGKNGAAPLNKTRTEDPLAGHAGIAAAVGRLAGVRNLSAPNAPVVPEKAPITFGWGLGETPARALEAGCTAATIGDQWSGKWRVTCPRTDKPALRVFDFGAFKAEGGISVEVNGPVGATYNFSGLVEIGGGSSLTMTAGTFNMAKGLKNSSVANFGAGVFRIGRADSDCNGAGHSSICNGGGGNITFGGPSIFEVQAGLVNGGGARMTLGSGTLNSYRIGPNSKGVATDLQGGAGVVMGDATGNQSVFEIVGDLQTGGGSCFKVPAAARHDIKGALKAGGGTIFGAGVYTVTDHFAFGAAGGGSVSCNNASVAATGSDVNFIIGGDKLSTQGSCNGYAFCVAAGYSGISLAAPKTGVLGRILVVGPQDSSRKSGATFSEGGSNGVFAGALYFPNGPISMSGGASAGGSNQGNENYCLQLIGSRVSLSGGATATSECIAAGGGASPKRVVLVQ
jgi:Flp pilus assembly protein TadG